MNNRLIKFGIRHVWEKKQDYKHDILLKDMFVVKHIGIFFSKEKIQRPKIKTRKKTHGKFKYDNKYTFGISLFWLKFWVSFR
jgi:hypothetical protein